MFDLGTVTIADVYRCSAEIRRIGETGISQDDVARRIVAHVFEVFRSRATGNTECVLVRLFLTRKLASCSEEEARGIVTAPGESVTPETTCLSLRASRGVRPEWNEPSLSRAHRLIPLISARQIATMPMISALVAQLGVPLGLLAERSVPLEGPGSSLGVFHVEDARGSACVPDQAEFVEPYGVRSVVGLGGILPPADVFILVIFSNEPISRTAAELFRVLAASVGIALLAPTDHGALVNRLHRYELALRQHEEIAEAAMSQAQESARTKDDLIACLGHELRNPLAPILTSVELMKLRGIHARELGVIERQALHLSRLIGDMLDLARMGRGKIELRTEPLEIADVVDRAVEAVRPALNERHQLLAVAVPSSGLQVNGDPDRLMQVVSNLIDNASKFSPTGSEIGVTAERADGRVRVSVRDHGIGIAPEMLETVFESFVQPTGKPFGGLGLGLAIVRGLVERHGGTVHAHSDGIGRGSELVFELPLRMEPKPTYAPRSDEPLVTPSAARRGKRVLIVDDDEDAASLLGEGLVTAGLVVRIAKDGHSAIDVAREFEPDVALVDIGLPDMSGYQVAEELLRLPLPEELHLVALTGYASEGARRQSAQAGFAAHLEKPVSLESVVRAVGA